MHKKKEEVKDDGFKYSGPMRPFPYSFKGHREVPKHIKRPEYAKSGIPHPRNEKVTPVVEGEDLEKLRLSCKIAREA